MLGKVHIWKELIIILGKSTYPDCELDRQIWWSTKKPSIYIPGVNQFRTKCTISFAIVPYLPTVTHQPYFYYLVYMKAWSVRNGNNCTRIQKFSKRQIPYFFFFVRLKQILNVLCDQRKLCHIHYVF